jgi:hypothetical protein
MRTVDRGQESLHFRSIVDEKLRCGANACGILEKKGDDDMVAHKQEAKTGVSDFSVTAPSIIIKNISTLFRKLRHLAETGPTYWSIASERGKMFRLFVANTPALREQAFQLGARLYRRMGYVPAEGQERLVSSFDDHPDTLILLITDEDGRAAATATIVYDNETDGLPLDDIYQAEADKLRAHGRRLAEYVRLAVDDSVRGCREVLVHLFSFGTIYSWLVMDYDDFVITVNPRHAPYYQRLLGFETVGEVKTCPKVQNAPAVLLRLSREYMERRISESGGRLTRERADRSLYPFFYAPEAEPFIAAFLRHRHKPMTMAEAKRLGPAVNE